MQRRRRERELLRLLRRAADARPLLHAPPRTRFADGSPVAVLSYAMWQSQYGGRRDVLGTKIQIASDRLHDHRRIAAADSSACGRTSRRRRSSRSRRYGAATAKSNSFLKGSWWRDVQLGLDVDDGPAQARRVDREGERGPHAGVASRAIRRSSSSSPVAAARAHAATRRRRIDPRRARAQRVERSPRSRRGSAACRSSCC